MALRDLLGLNRIGGGVGLEERDEAFRVLRANLEVALLDIDRPTVAITSASPGEGKTATCVQLAQAVALGGRKVVVVDLDLRMPKAHTYLGVPNKLGLTDVLLEDVTLTDALQYLGLKQPNQRRARGLYFLSAGSRVENPTELLGLGRLPRVLSALAQQADLVLLDSPPVLPVADALLIGRLADGVMLTVESRFTRTDEAQAARDALVRNQARILGVVLNKVRSGDGVPGGYGYGESYLYGNAAVADGPRG